MSVSSIAIPLDDQVLLQKLLDSSPQTLLAQMDDMSREARMNGLTQEILDDILHE